MLCGWEVVTWVLRGWEPVTCFQHVVSLGRWTRRGKLQSPGAAALFVLRVYSASVFSSSVQLTLCGQYDIRLALSPPILTT